MYTIIEDCSPYYIRFKFDKLSSIIGYLNSLPENVQGLTPTFKQYEFTHRNLSKSEGNPLLQMLPLAQQLPLKRDRFAIFSTSSGGGCGIHKDANDHKVSINIPFMIKDDKCITSWYDDAQFEGLEAKDAKSQYAEGNGYARSVFPDYKEMHKFTPIMTMTAKPNEALLFNTDIYHSWDNTNSLYDRKVLTIRPLDTANVDYNTVKQILMENEV